MTANRRPKVSDGFFSQVHDPIPFAGAGSTDPLAFKVYQPDRLVLGKRMEDHLRPGVCFWHSFAWAGTDMFGLGTLDRPWISDSGDPMAAARQKMAAAFEFFTKLGVPYYCFHDRDVAPEGDSFAEFRDNLDALADDAARLPGAHRRPAAVGHGQPVQPPALPGRAPPRTPTRRCSPTPPRRSSTCSRSRSACGGENYVLWGGREGYDTLLNTDLRREGAQLARFLHLVAEHKHRIGFKGPLLIEPKPMEPTKHQYDYDAATVYGFLVRNGLEGEYRLNIEANHATLAGHSFHHEVAYARSRTGSSAASTRTAATPRTAGTPTSSRTRSRTWRCRSTRSCAPAASRPAASTSTPSCAARARDRTDLFHAHIGGIDTTRPGAAGRRRTSWSAVSSRRTGTRAMPAGTANSGGRSSEGSLSLADLEARVGAGEIDPNPVSGGQERLENLVNRSLWPGR